MEKTMGKCMVMVFILVCFLFLFTGSLSAAAPEYTPVPGMPDIGKWMLQSDGSTPANWLGQQYQGKEIQEPINVIIVDAFATSGENAKERLMSAAAAAGYESRTGHSSGYKGYIGGTIHTQLPEETNHAFSTNFFWLDNNHGRAFGPHFFEGKYYFIIAMSREVIGLSKPMHKYDSFEKARDDFAAKMISKAGYQKIQSVDLQNKIAAGDANKTTGDHDGMAIVLEAVR